MKIDNLDMKRSLYSSLNERQRRHFAAVEAKTLGHGGIKVVWATFRIDPVTVRKGIRELLQGDELGAGRIRRMGAGRKKKLPSIPS